MSIFNSFFRKFKDNSGSNAKIYVPLFNYSETRKRYINTMDRTSDKTADFEQLVIRLLSMKGVREEFKQLNLGSKHDAYQLENFMESALNTLALSLEDCIQLEFQNRKELLNLEKIYQEFTSLSLTEDQRLEFLEFEKIYKNAYLSEVLQKHKDKIIAGNKTTQDILENERLIQKQKIEIEKNSTELATLKSSVFKTTAQNNQKNHYTKKSKEYPSLSEFYMKKLQKSIDSIKNIRNGQGNTSDLEFEKSNYSGETNKI